MERTLESGDRFSLSPVGGEDTRELSSHGLLFGKSGVEDHGIRTEWQAPFTYIWHPSSSPVIFLEWHLAILSTVSEALSTASTSRANPQWNWDTVKSYKINLTLLSGNLLNWGMKEARERARKSTSTIQLSQQLFFTVLIGQAKPASFTPCWPFVDKCLSNSSHLPSVSGSDQGNIWEELPELG